MKVEIDGKEYFEKSVCVDAVIKHRKDILRILRDNAPITKNKKIIANHKYIIEKIKA